MDKQEIINQIIVDMNELPKELLDKLRVSLAYHLRNVRIEPSETLPANNQFENEYITVKAYCHTVQQFLEINSLHWSVVTSQDITSYLAVRRYRDKIASSYMSIIRKHLSVFFGWLFRNKYIADDIMVNIPSIRCTARRKERLTDDEIEVCRSVSKVGIEKALFELMISTGLRVGEIRSLNVENINFEKSEILVWGEKSSQWRTVFMTPACKYSLKSYVGDRKDGILFTNRGRRISLASIEKIAKDISIRANCHVVATVHTYRKTFASVLYRKTNDSLLVSKLLGHNGVDVTVQCYLVDDIEEMKHKVLKVA